MSAPHLTPHSSPLTILIMAGGTGGHVMPALAVAEALRTEGWRVVWLGTQAGMEAKLAVEKGFEMAWVKIAGVRGKGLFNLLMLPVKLLAAFWQALRAIRAIKPDVALGLGGYVAFPGGMMASLMNCPLVIHEQNAIAGLTNRVLACLAERVLTGLPAAFRNPQDKPLPCRTVKSEWVGNPVREEICSLPPPEQRYAGRSGPLNLLIIGGSLGAQRLNEIVPLALGMLPPELRPNVRHQAGIKHFEDLQRHYAEAHVEAQTQAFIRDMAEAYSWADVVICRAGALTVAEIAASGSAALFVPFPHAVDDHQTANAEFMSKVGAAWLMAQRDLTPDGLADWLKALDRKELQVRASKAHNLAKTDATRRVVAIVKEVAR